MVYGKYPELQLKRSLPYIAAAGGINAKSNANSGNDVSRIPLFICESRS